MELCLQTVFGVTDGFVHWGQNILVACMKLKFQSLQLWKSKRGIKGKIPSHLWREVYITFGSSKVSTLRFKSKKSPPGCITIKLSEVKASSVASADRKPLEKIT